MQAVRSLVEQHIDVLVRQIGPRPPGSAANRRAVAHARATLVDCGWDVVEHPFTTRWWEPGTGRLVSMGTTLRVLPDPYSPATDVRGPTVDVERVEDLEALDDATDAILVLRGDLASEQLLPTAFPFLDPPEHARIRDTLRRLAPRAVVAVSDHWQPILEDPDLAIPSTTISTDAGARLRPGEDVRLVLGGAVHAGSGTNLSARAGDGDRVVVSAHLDSKSTTPGAFDNAAGVAAVLAAAAGGLADVGSCEVVLFNGEDHFDACGEVAWLAATDLDDVVANLNVDGVGLAGRGTSVATLACPDRLRAALHGWVQQRTGWTRAEPWYESDHAVFAMRGIPAVAVTSQDVHALLAGLAHTPADTLEVLDLAVVEDVALALPDLVALLGCEEEAAGLSPSNRTS